MIRHIALITCLTVAALATGVAIVPGEREQWTMLVRDGRNEEALKTLEAHYQAGRHEIDALVHLHKLYMSFADIARATRVMQTLVADHPGNPEAIALLARHYGDIQDKGNEVATLERLFELSPSLPVAGDLLAYYRFEGAFDREENLLRTLLSQDLITANDADGLGLSSPHAATCSGPARPSCASMRLPIPNAALDASCCSKCWWRRGTRRRRSPRPPHGSAIFARRASITRLKGRRLPHGWFV